MLNGIVETRRCTDITEDDGGGAAANMPMVVVGTMKEDVVFEVVDDAGIPDSNPSYPASSLQSIRFQVYDGEHRRSSLVVDFGLQSQ